MYIIGLDSVTAQLIIQHVHIWINVITFHPFFSYGYLGLGDKKEYL
jgi:hypothetical protein